MRPVSESRARNLMMYLPGSNVKPVSYSIGRRDNSPAVSQLHVHFVAQILNGGAVFILHFADKIDECALGTSGASEHELAAWNLDGDRNEILRAVQLEVIHFHCDGEVCDRIAQDQSVLELPLFIGCCEFVERLARVIPLAVVQFCRRRFFQGDLDTSE